MNYEELSRAVRLNCPPPDTTGRCEYGMGLKTAASWFGDVWHIRTKRLGNEEEYSVTFNVSELEKNGNTEIYVESKKAPIDQHYTIIIIEKLHKTMKARTKGRIKDQLASMFRQDLRLKEIDIAWNGQPLEFNEPPIFVEEHNDGTKTKWKKEVSFEVQPDGDSAKLKVHGWVGIRLPGSIRDGGIVLLRRNRVIEGGPELGYRPEEIFGSGNTYRKQRLIGELNLDEWPVSHSKDKFDWSGTLEEYFIDELKKACKDYMDKSEEYRVKDKPLTEAEMGSALQPTKNIVSNPDFGKDLAVELAAPTPLRTEHEVRKDLEKISAVSRGPQIINVQMRDTQWMIEIRWQDKISSAPWMELEFPQENKINIFLNSAHPFFHEYVDDSRVLELITKLIVALALAEKISRQLHGNQMIHPDYFRQHMNNVLHIMSKVRDDDREKNTGS